MLRHEVVEGSRGVIGEPGRLWYAEPATRWFEALPIGTGRLGGMVYSGAAVERIRLSESTAWSGAPATTDVSPTGLAQLPRIREHLFNGRYAEAQALAGEHLLGRPTSFGTNVPLPELLFDFGEGDEPTEYERSLDLTDAIVRTSYTRGGISFTREVFASHAHQVIVLRSITSAPTSFKISFSDDAIPSEVSTEDDTLVLRGHAYEFLHSNGRVGSAVEIRTQVVADGSITAEDDHLQVNNATTATVIIAVGTDWQGDDPAASASLVSNAIAAGFDQLKQAHLDDYTPLVRRVALDLGRTEDGVRALPTGERRALFAKGGEDPELVSLYFQYGRYLTIAGSRADSPLPLALQGLWNDGLASTGGWTNDFHLDINTQQNYWAAEITGLGECQQPLFTFIERLAASGRRTAEELYGAPGWVSHTVTNAWGYTAPGWGLGWGLHVTSGIWISLQLWEHFEYNRDLAFLARKAYPILREAAQFFLAYLVEDPSTGRLLSGPSDSPENWYLSPDGEECSISMGNTTDRVLIEALFRICIEASELLGIDEELRRDLSTAREKLPPFQIGKHGRLQEWLIDFDEAAPSHRHTSHLIAVYPERQITPRDTPDLARAAEVVIERRQAADGWEQTEWVEANLMAFSARLLQGDRALQHLRGLIGDASEHNLMSYSAGGIAGAEQNIYSFDGNSAGTAALAELLVQSTQTEIELLPALPTSWSAGTVQGLRARGGYTVDVSWDANRMTSATISGGQGEPLHVRLGDEVIELTIDPGTTVRITN